MCSHTWLHHWYIIFPITLRYWLLLATREVHVPQLSLIIPGEEVAARIVSNKNHLTKVMFLIAVMRPMYDQDGNCIFDGKIGL